MSSATLYNLMRFLLLATVQVLLLDQVNLAGYINPQLYILFVVLYPVGNNKYIFQFVSFLLGLVIDVFNDTGGAHAAAALTVAFARPILLALVYGEAYGMKNLKVLRTDIDRLLLLLLLCILLHHLVLYILIVFDVVHILFTLKLVLLNGLATLVLGSLLLLFFKPKRTN